MVLTLSPPFSSFFEICFTFFTTLTASLAIFPTPPRLSISFFAFLENFLRPFHNFLPLGLLLRFPFPSFPFPLRPFVFFPLPFFFLPLGLFCFRFFLFAILPFFFPLPFFSH